MTEHVTELTRLREENERLRAELEAAQNAVFLMGNDPEYLDDETVTAWAEVMAMRAARLGIAP
jgi:hypothetical protein